MGVKEGWIEVKPEETRGITPHSGEVLFEFFV